MNLLYRIKTNMSARYLFLLVLFIASLGLKAQDRIGVGYTHYVYDQSHFIFVHNQSKSSNRPVIALQRWISDKYFNYYTFDFGSTTLENVRYGELKMREKVSCINFHFGQGAYFGKKRFEDNTALFGTYGFSFGAGLLETYHFGNYVNGVQEWKRNFTGALNFSVIELGLGIEQRISDRYFANVSFNANIGLLSYASLEFRLYYSRYQH